MQIALKLLVIVVLTTSKLAYSDEAKVCFYTEDNFQGEMSCFSPGDQIDLFNKHKDTFHSEDHWSIIDNDSARSIKIPKGMMTKIYSNDGFNPPFYSLTESANADQLSSLEMYNEITSIKVLENKRLNCDQKCTIFNIYRINLAESFGHYWSDGRLPNKQILLVFNSPEQGRNDSYSVALSHGPSISMIEKGITFSDYSMLNKFVFAYKDNVDTLSLIIQIKEDTVQIQYIQTLDDDVVDISPIISFKWLHNKDTAPEIIIRNYNDEEPLILNKSILAADTGDHNWAKRDLTQTSQVICSFVPFLNIYNYITHGTCQQLSNIVFSAVSYFSNSTKGKTLHIAGDSRPLKEQSSINPDSDQKGFLDNQMTLTYIDSTKNHQSLSLPAVAKTCMVPIYSLLNTRQSRQIRPYCINWTLDIMTDFTLLFGTSLQTWNSDYFSQIIDTIMRTGNTGTTIAEEHRETEQRLSQTVRESIMTQSSGNALNQIKTAFDYAQLSYLNHSFYYTSDDMPARVEQLPLGIYELLLDTFIYKPITPQVMEDGQIVAHPEIDFEFEILTTPTPEEVVNLSAVEIERERTSREQLIETIAQWVEQYQSTHIEQHDNPDQASALNKTRHAGNIVTGIIHRRLIIKRPGEIYVVVKFRGEIIAIVLADRFNNRDQVELVASATQPNYVLSPYAEGTVRGAGTAAVSVLAQYLQQQGAKILFSEVISEPSARVKQKVGFTFKSQF
ncbi:GNAT family N-acetyltransferase [Yersinia mollaretii]|uniref:GNAT family N-acetyltransferase n=1 Tax=Yersinia mollaretii TaxID=33060 RepID=A0AA44HZF6_YERMO|nr:GNAT family N-acetyltransferase [Yersinia mollaretii]NIL22379.1 GNAT family N-acetyltransferase [Yersinia mollaretii]CNI54441.1 acetyltransferase domain-containing protein [Yersinia mollaretii]CQQ48544.1 acetyltransferase domain-containing protein [Yersinia mollaretii]